MKKLILPIAILLLVGIIVMVLVSADFIQNYNSVDNTVTFNFKKAGWYLLSPRASYVDPRCDNSDSIRAVWIWLPSQQRYVGVNTERSSGSSSSDDGKLFESEISSGYFKEGLSSVWIYLSRPCTISFKFHSSNQNSIKLAKGWNFLLVNPLYNGKSLNELKGDCNIVKAYGWNADVGGWSKIGLSLNDANSRFDDSSVGSGFIVKVSGNCTFGSESANILNPPEIPNY